MTIIERHKRVIVALFLLSLGWTIVYASVLMAHDLAALVGRVLVYVAGLVLIAVAAFMLGSR